LWRKYNYGNRKVTQQHIQEQIIKTHRKNGIIPTQVNLVGWSRGGVSCHMLANAMLADAELRNTKVNIFAIDPVPGTTNFQPEKVSLGSNVKQYVGFYARDERSKGFACVIPKTSGSTGVHIYPLPGRHATLAGNAASNGVSGPKTLHEPGTIVRHFAETCLTRWGVPLNKKLNLGANDLVALHKAMTAQQALYLAMQSQSYTVLTEQDNKERYVSYGDQGVHFSAINGPAFAPERGLSADLSTSEHTYKEIR
jgi:hypothetical protein